MLHWQREALNKESSNIDLEAKIVDDESTIRRWMNHCDNLNARVNNLTLENNKLVKKIESMTEELAVEEMEEILEMIISAANTDFEYLVDAVEFLLELG